MRVMVINPWLKTVTEKQLTDSGNIPSRVKEIYETLTSPGERLVDDFNFVKLASRVGLYVDGEGFLKPDVPVFYILGHGRPNSLRPLAGMGILFGGVDEEGNDLGLPEHISQKFCFDAVTFSQQYSTGRLAPTIEEAGRIIIGEPILKGDISA